MHGSYPAWVGELLQAVSGLLALLRVLRWTLGHVFCAGSRRLVGCFLPDFLILRLYESLSLSLVIGVYWSD
jgi:hypothetical protein